MSTAPTCWLAPAKLNLFLHVTGRRDDGYHTLQTAFVFLDIHDRLSFEINQTGEISRKDVADRYLPEEDLCVRAAKALQAYSCCELGVQITLEKNLPAGAGLGGGSSDAATTLIALNTLWGLGLARENLIEIGRALGADVPVFLHGVNTLAEGVGDVFHALEHMPQYFLVLVPKIHVSTAEIFSDSSLTRDTPIMKIRGSLPPGLSNDLEAVTCRRYPAVKYALDWLKMHGDARMSGTGASVFVACDTLEAAKKLFHQRPAGLDGFVTKSLACHPHK